MQFRIKLEEVVIFIPFLNLLLFCSAFSNPIWFQVVEKGGSYFNLVIITCSFIFMISNHDIRAFIYSIVLILLLFTICLLNKTSVGALTNFLTLLFSIYYCSRFELSITYFEKICVLGFIYFVLALIRTNEYIKLWKDGVAKVNPNMICICIFIFSIFINAYFYIKKNRKNNIIKYVYNGCSIYMVFRYGSRTILFVMTIYLFLLAFDDISKWILLKQKFFMAVIIVMGIIFPYFYINAPDSIVHYISLKTGKSFYSGREIIWTNFFNSLTDAQKVIIGPGSRLADRIGTIVRGGETFKYSVHSSFLSMILGFGLLGIVIYYLTITAVTNDEVSNELKYLKLGYLCLMIVGFAEVTMTYVFTVIPISVLLSCGIENIREIQDKEN